MYAGRGQTAPIPSGSFFVHEGHEGDACRGREGDRIPADAYSRERISHRSGKMGVISVVARY